MNRIESIKYVRSEVGISAMLPFTHLNSPTIFECKNGFIGSTLKVCGVPYLTESNQVLNQLNSQWHQALTGLDERFIQYVTIYRKKQNISLAGEFKHNFAREINDKYHSKFRKKTLFENNIYLTTVLKDADFKTGSRGLNFLNQAFSLLKSQNIRGLNREFDMEILKNKVGELKSALATFNPVLLGESDDEKGYSELLQFLALLINGKEDVLFKHPKTISTVAKSIIDAEKKHALYPEENISQYLASERIFFGSYIQFQGAVENACRFGAILSIKHYGSETSHVILDPLFRLECEFIATHSFAPLPRDKGLKNVALKRNKLLNAGDLGKSQIADLELLEDALAGESVTLGYHHNSLLIFADSTQELNQYILDVIKAYSYAGIVLVRETLGAEPMYFAQMPGNHHFIARSALITSQNFTDFCPLHNNHHGFKDDNHLGSAVSVFETPDKTPLYFNFHTKGSRTNPAPGHTAVYGANNAGKNTLVAFLDSQMGRYNNRTFFLDRNEATKIYVMSYENSSYTVISPEHKNSVQMNPFLLDDLPENRTFLKNFLHELVKKPDEVELDGEIAELLNECVNYAFESLHKSFRQLSHIVKILPLNFPRWPELRRFLRGDGLYEEGEYAWLFDNSCDLLDFNFDKVGFDITYLTDEVSSYIATPVYMFLLHRMRQCLDGRLTSFVIDEAWQVFSSTFWLKVLNSWVPTIRKLNGHFVFMTQSPETVLSSSIAPIIFANVVTTLIFPNQQASHDTYISGLGLSEEEFEIVRNTNIQSRFFLYRQHGEPSMLCRLNLTGMDEEIRVFSANKNTVKLFNKIIEELNTKQPDILLPEFYKRSAHL